MSIRSTKKAIAPVVDRAVWIAEKQDVLAVYDNPSTRKLQILHWRELGWLTDDEASLLIEHNGLEAA